MLCILMLFCSVVAQGQGVDVTNKEGEVTRFPLTESATLIAHNHLDGKYFSQIKVGDTVMYLDGDSTTDVFYEVVEVVAAQANQPLSVHTSLLIDGQWMTPEQVYHRVGYLDPDKLVLQTCIDAYGDPSWGRLFVIAIPRQQVEVGP